LIPRVGRGEHAESERSERKRKGDSPRSTQHRAQNTQHRAQSTHGETETATWNLESREKSGESTEKRAPVTDQCRKPGAESRKERGDVS
jgi:hypothetical protein